MRILFSPTALRTEKEGMVQESWAQLEVYAGKYQFRPLTRCQQPLRKLAGFPNGLCTSTYVINTLFSALEIHPDDFFHWQTVVVKGQVGEYL